MSEWHWTGVPWGEYKGAKCKLFPSKCSQCKEIRLTQYKQYGKCPACIQTNARAHIAAARVYQHTHEDFTAYYAHNEEVWSPAHRTYFPLPIDTCPKCGARPERYSLEVRCCCGWRGYVRFTALKPAEQRGTEGNYWDAHVEKTPPLLSVQGHTGRRTPRRPSLDDYNRAP